MSRVVRRIVRNPVKAVKEVVAGVGAAAGGTPDQPAPKAVEPTKPAIQPKEAVKPKPATGAVSGQSADARSKAAQRRGRRSNIMTGSRGVSGNVQTTKKTLLGG